MALPVTHDQKLAVKGFMESLHKNRFSIITHNIINLNVLFILPQILMSVKIPAQTIATTMQLVSTPLGLTGVCVTKVSMAMEQFALLSTGSKHFWIP